MWQATIRLGQSLFQGLRQVGPSSNAETSILNRGIFKGIPERQGAG